MSDHILFVKNMVCQRCILAVEETLRNSAISFRQVIIGEIHLMKEISREQADLLGTRLARIGLELMDSRMGGMIEKIKHLIIKKARNEIDQKENKIKLSSYLSQYLHHEYTYLSSFFSSGAGRTIENYFIEQRVEKVKELLTYKEMSLSEISFEMEYSSVAHLSNQFKKITGLTPSHFRQSGSFQRKMLDQI